MRLFGLLLQSQTLTLRLIRPNFGHRPADCVVLAHPQCVRAELLIERDQRHIRHRRLFACAHRSADISLKIQIC